MPCHAMRTITARLLLYLLLSELGCYYCITPSLPCRVCSTVHTPPYTHHYTKCSDPCVFLWPGHRSTSHQTQSVFKVNDISKSLESELRFSAASVFSATLIVTYFSHENNQMLVDTPNESWESQLPFGVSKSIWRFSWKKR